MPFLSTPSRFVFSSVVALSSLSLFAPACTTTTIERATPDGGQGAPPSAPTSTADAADLGQDCSFGTNPGVLAATADTHCAEGVCLADTREGIDAYCTVDCALKNCPAGYTCEDVTYRVGPARVCTRNPSVCGDGILAKGETCDDGNVADGDSCSADCQTVVPKMGTVAITKLTIDGEDVAAGSYDLFPPANDTLGCGNGDALSYSYDVNGTLRDDRAALKLIVCKDGRQIGISVTLSKRSTEPLSSFDGQVVVADLNGPNTAPKAQWSAAGPPEGMIKVTGGTKTGDRYVTLKGTITMKVANGAAKGGPLDLALSFDVAKLNPG